MLAVILLGPAGSAFGQTPGTAPAEAPAPPVDSPRVWSFRLAAASYFLPDEDDYVQPTAIADRGALHLETRYNYEGRDSVSMFAGWTFSAGSRVKFELTPMFGGVAGDTDAVVPALELSLDLGWLDFYSEGEYVIDVNNTGDRFLYNWSELSVWPTGWLRGGIVVQRTRVFDEPRDIQRGLLLGVAVGRVEGTAYVFNPWSDNYYAVAALAISF